jgi:hypothetical protein
MDENNGRWHLDKRFSWGHILTTIGLLIVYLVWSTDMDKRVVINSLEIDQNEKDIMRIEKNIVRQYEEIKVMLMRLEDKLDSHEANRGLKE